MFNPQPKQAQVDRGTPPAKRGKNKTPKAIGNAGEIQAGQALCEVLGQDKKSFRRNNQAVPYGGINNFDITVKGLEGWAIEVKTTRILHILKWWKTLLSEIDRKRPMLIFTLFGEQLVLTRLADLGNLAQDVAEGQGYVLEPIPGGFLS